MLMQGEMLWTGWVGDSRAVVVREVGEALRCEDLTQDHKPEVAEEARRILAHGGRVDCVRVGPDKLPAGPLRVWLADPAAAGPGLSMTRSLGDGLAKQIGVSAEPQVVERRLDPSLRAAVLASDGVWEVLAGEELAALLAAQLFRADAQRAAREIVAVCDAKWGRVS